MRWWKIAGNTNMLNAWLKRFEHRFGCRRRGRSRQVKNMAQELWGQQKGLTTDIGAFEANIPGSERLMTHNTGFLLGSRAKLSCERPHPLGLCCVSFPRTDTSIFGLGAFSAGPSLLPRPPSSGVPPAADFPTVPLRMELIFDNVPVGMMPSVA